MKVKFSPSLMCMDLLHVEREIRKLDTKADYYHVDIIDWHYCRNMSLAPCFMEAISKITRVPQDAHLYVDNIDTDLIALCMDSGAAILTMPPEVIERQAFRLIRQIRAAGRKVGVFINPAADLRMIEPYADLLDRLLIMTVDPGFAGQEFVAASLNKIAMAQRWKREFGYHYEIAVDGCCNERYYQRLYEAGAEVFVVGSSGLFSKSADTLAALAIAERFIDAATEGKKAQKYEGDDTIC